jgi:hypothetical protein
LLQRFTLAGLVGLFFTETLVPAAIGVTVAMFLSGTGYLIIRIAQNPDDAVAE